MLDSCLADAILSENREPTGRKAGYCSVPKAPATLILNPYRPSSALCYRHSTLSTPPAMPPSPSSCNSLATSSAMDVSLLESGCSSFSAGSGGNCARICSQAQADTSRNPGQNFLRVISHLSHSDASSSAGPRVTIAGPRRHEANVQIQDCSEDL